eukprot:scaffold1277_cov137-Skeletonema_menzelii.AAC.11
MNWYNNNNFTSSYAGAGPYGYNDHHHHNYDDQLAHHVSAYNYRHFSGGNYGHAPSFEEYRRHSYQRHPEEDDDYTMSWEQDGWVPLTKSGKQKSPNQIRNELQRYIDQCKANGTSNQTRIIERMGVNSNSFRKFMDPSTYTNQWNATTNGTYWAAAKLLAKVAYEKELAKATGGSGSKRKSTRDDYDSDDYDYVQAEANATKRYKSNSGEIKKTRAEVQLEALTLIQNIISVHVPDDGIVYDSCPELVKKIKAFLARDGMTKIHEGKPKSSARIGNEIEHPYGFPLVKPRNPRVLGQPYRPYGRSTNSAPTMSMHEFLGMRGFF